MHHSKRISRRSFSLASLALAACGRVTSTPEEQPGLPLVDAGPLPVDAALEQEDSGCVGIAQPISHRTVSSETLYTWTTQGQIDILRTTGELLQRSERPGEGPGALFEALAVQAKTTQRRATRELFEYLLGPTFAKGRFTWVNPWGAALGYKGESYGDQLLEIRLRPEALLVRVFQGLMSDGNTCNDIDIVHASSGTPFTGPFDSSTRARIAGVYFVNERAQSGSLSICSREPPNEAGSYREIYLGNASMILQCSHATQAIIDKVQAEIRHLSVVMGALDSDAGALEPNPDNAECLWQAKVLSTAWNQTPRYLVDGYESQLCFLDAPYRPLYANLAALIVRLQERTPLLNPFVKNFG